MDRRLDRLYRRYCARGELAALARLFDLAAPELLAVAKHLCGDEAEAEDAVQATFLTLIEKRASFDRERRFAPWALGILAKHAHAARRRAERELDPRRLGSGESDEPRLELESAETQAAIGARIDALPATYAAAVRAHVFDGASPSDIGARLAISSNAASVRVHRGLRLLRRLLPPGSAAVLVATRPTRGLAALRAELLQRALLASAAIVPSTAAGLVAGALSGGILVKKLVISCAAVAAALVGWMTFGDEPSPTPEEAVEVVLAPGDTVTGPPEQAQGGPASVDSAPARMSLTAEGATQPLAAPTHGSAFVSLRWKDSNRPAGAVGVMLFGQGADSRESTSDAHGVARFVDLAPGRWTVRVDRSRVQQSFELAAGEEAEIELELPRAVEVTGTVIDFRGEPVAGAAVLLMGLHVVSSGRVAATSGADGRFVLSELDPDCRLAARARGYAPSAVRVLSEPGALAAGALEVQLVLPARGGTLAGRVVDGAGEPVAGATLEIGGYQDAFSAESEGFLEPLQKAPDGSMSTPARPLPARTDAAGTFECDGIELGSVRVRVRPPKGELAAWNGSIDVSESERAWLEVRLGFGATLAGRVTDSSGDPVARVDVEAWGADQSLRREARTDDDGRYRIERVPLGRTEVRANKRRAQGLSLARVELELAEGSLTEWNAVLPPALAIAGRVVDEQGDPLGDWSARAFLESNRMEARPSSTDADGRFRIEGCADSEYRLELRPPDAEYFAPPRAWLQQVRPGADELELVADTTSGARIVARVVDARGEPMADGRLWATMQPLGRYVTADTDPASGSVEISDLPAGRYMLTVVSPRYPNEQLGERDLGTDETLDLGEIVLVDPGRIVLRVVRADGAAPDGLEVDLRTAEDRQSTVPIAVETPGVARSGPAPAGSYALTLRAAGCASKRIVVELAQGEQVERSVELIRGVDCLLQFEPPRGVEARWASVEILDVDRELVLRAHAFDPAQQGRIRIAERLAPGRYVVRATSSDPPLAGETEIEVLDATGEQSFVVPLSP